MRRADSIIVGLMIVIAVAILAPFIVLSMD